MLAGGVVKGQLTMEQVWSQEFSCFLLIGQVYSKWSGVFSGQWLLGQVCCKWSAMWGVARFWRIGVF